MSQRVVTQLISDLSGDEIADGTGETIEFSYRGQSYAIDLTDKETAGFNKSIAMYIEHASKATAAQDRRSTRRSSTAATQGHSKDELANIRVWAEANGHTISQRGRIKQSIVEAYHNAQA